MIRYEHFLNWCKNNATVFDFFSKIVFSLITGTIAYNAVNIAATQRDIQKAQLEVQRIQAQAQLEPHLPNINVRYVLRDQNGPRIDDLIVSNEGAEVFSLNIEVFPYWHPRELEIIHPGERRDAKVQLKSALVPIENFFSPISHANSEPRGQLIKLLGRTHEKWDEEIREFEKSNTTAQHSITSDIKLFVRARYTDKFGKSHQRYFEVQYWGTRPLGETEGQTMASEYYEHVNSGNKLNFEAPIQKNLELIWKMLLTPKDSNA